MFAILKNLPNRLLVKYTAEHIHETGKRENNEDAFLIDKEQALFMVCDGVGGSNKGEEASRLAVESFGSFLKNKEISDATINKALRFTESRFDNFIKAHPDSEGMSTTLTLLKLSDNKALLTHCGDSRVYHIRNNKIIFKTKDHSLVQELLNGGYITEEEAKNHPKKNHITQALIAGKKLSGSLESVVIEDIQENDFFLLCSDGILESISDGFIEDSFSANSDLTELKSKISAVCKEHSKDNYTAVLIKIADTNNNVTNSQARKSSFGKRIAKLILILVLVAFIYLILNCPKSDNNTKEPTQSEQTTRE